MKDFLVQYIHVFIILWSGWNGFLLWEEKDAEIVAANERLERSQAKLDKSRSSIKRIDKFQKNLDESEKRVKVVVEKLKQIQRQLPSQINDTEVQRTLEKIAKELKMINMDTKPKGEVLHPDRFYFTKDYDFVSSGTFLQGLIFFERLENLSRDGRILNIKSLNLSLNPQAGSKSRFRVLNMNTTLESYRYNPAYRATER